MAMPVENAALNYAIRTGIVLALILYLRPWRWYAGIKWAHVTPAVLVGAGVFVVWVAGESRFAGAFPAVQEFYQHFGMMPLCEIAPAEDAQSAYHPQTCGWILTGVRIFGSFAIIALAEEFFWRGCLYRILIDRDFDTVALDRFHALAFWAVCIAFGFEHQRWFVGILAGLAYAILMMKTRSIWPPIIAHALTNLLLGLYVVWGNHYAFWG